MHSRFARGLLCASLIFVCSFASAKEHCDCTVSQFRDMEDLRDMMVNVAVYGDAEHRKTEQELATPNEKVDAIHARYSATGTLNCPGNEGSAQVTLKNNIITTAGHAFRDPNDPCKQISSPSQCTLVLTSLSGAEQKIPLDDFVDIGLKCGQKPGGKDDWAVVKLKGVATGVQPYAVEEIPAKGLTEGAPVTLVAHSADFWRKDRFGNKVFPKHIQRGCHIRKVYSAFEPEMYKGDCDASLHASGGSLLVEGASGPILYAIISGQNESRESARAVEYDNQGDKSKPNMAEYNEKTWAGYHVPVTGNFLRAIRSVK